ncbi:TonB-dependent receptor [Siphonobacter sp. SORGH_AS_0500]|uniref:TonB-dependent receptor n=1 Tax=Siphonobacter sp. SORGH_AS_0500 TaxID=1864824 RepID=UPI000D0E9C50|nr:TonB-dependent receptor [Siphonobacter sp. SORGH_AS_0500]
MKPLQSAARHLITLMLILSSSLVFAQQVAQNQRRNVRTLSGYVREAQSGTALVGVSVSLPSLGLGATTNAQGYYSIELPARPFVQIAFSFIGYKTESMATDVNTNTTINVSLEAQSSTLQEVVVKSRTGNGSSKVSESVQMSTLSVPIQQIKEIPSLLGEKDVLKSLQLMPGVQKGTDGSTGMYVRGGGPDQNLILLDDAPVYNTSHLFGFFSLFNGDAIQSVNLTKGGFGAHFGGRLSSVVEMEMKDGNQEKWHGEGGIGLISSRFTLDGPIQKGKSSFLVSARRTYADVVLRPFVKNIADRNGYFYDFNVKASFDVTPNDYISVSAYTGKDRFVYTTAGQISNESGNLNWGNTVGTLRWKHRFSPGLTATSSAIFTQYHSHVHMSRDVVTDEAATTFRLNNATGIRDMSLKTDFTWVPSSQHIFKAGVIATAHQFNPSTSTVNKDFNSPAPAIETLRSVEGAVYLEDTYSPTPALKINAGLRLSAFKSETKLYTNPEPRLAIAYTLPRQWALKASYSVMNQYVHLLSNSGIGLPTDLWIPSSDQTAPQYSQQTAFGIAKDMKSGWSFTAEGFYKSMNNMVAYKEGASSFSYDGSDQVSWEDQITYGKGWSYGMELLLQKKAGRFTGWAGYTLSWTQQQFDELNFGKKFWARYDRRHDVSLVGTYHLSPKVTFSATYVYGTGQAMTLPKGQYWIQGNSALKNLGDKSNYTGRVYQEYGQRNNFRAAAYQRLDVGVQFHKTKKGHERTWEISVSNATNHQNPFFYYFDASQSSTTPGTKNTTNTLKQVTLFPILPSVSYNFKF